MAPASQVEKRTIRFDVYESTYVQLKEHVEIDERTGLVRLPEHIKQKVFRLLLSELTKAAGKGSVPADDDDDEDDFRDMVNRRRTMPAQTSH